MLPIESFATLLRPAERKRCLENLVTRKWYSVLPDIFTSFIFRVSTFHTLSFEESSLYTVISIAYIFILYLVGDTVQQEISQGADSAVRKYIETTRETGSTPKGAAKAMREGALERKEALTSKMFKILSVANPGNGMGFLKEV